MQRAKQQTLHRPCHDVGRWRRLNTTIRQRCMSRVASGKEPLTVLVDGDRVSGGARDALIYGAEDSCRRVASAVVSMRSVGRCSRRPSTLTSSGTMLDPSAVPAASSPNGYPILGSPSNASSQPSAVDLGCCCTLWEHRGGMGESRRQNRPE